MKQPWGLVLADLYGRKLRRPVIINGEIAKDEDGKPVIEDLTLAMVCAESLVNHQDGDEKSSNKDKMRRHDLARRIIDAKDDADVAMDVKQLAEMIERVNKGGWHSVIVSDVTGMLEINTKQ